MTSRLLPLAASDLRQIQLVATDVDGTLTDLHQFTPRLLTALQALQTAGITVVLTTGRSAGWVSALAYYLPVAGAIAENGGVYLSRDGTITPLSAIADVPAHRQRLDQSFQALTTRFPALQASSDNAFRLTDWTFDLAGLAETELMAIAANCQAQGWGFTYSNVQGHIKQVGQDKATGLKQLLVSQFPSLSPNQVLTIGDSPNDDAMFNPALFPVSVGVVNLLHYSDTLRYQPRYITTQPEVAGFCELVEQVLGSSDRLLL